MNSETLWTGWLLQSLPSNILWSWEQCFWECLKNDNTLYKCDAVLLSLSLSNVILVWILVRTGCSISSHNTHTFTKLLISSFEVRWFRIKWEAPNFSFLKKEYDFSLQLHAFIVSAMTNVIYGWSLCLSFSQREKRLSRHDISEGFRNVLLFIQSFKPWNKYQILLMNIWIYGKSIEQGCKWWTLHPGKCLKQFSI